mgnify:CR=1 FL=1
MPVSNITNNGSTFTFSINSPISIVNAIRRTIISEIPTFVFETSPEEKNNMVIQVNTSRLNNEILKVLEEFSKVTYEQSLGPRSASPIREAP